MNDYSFNLITKIENSSLCKDTVFGCFSDYGPYIFVLVFVGVVVYCFYLYIKETSPEKNKFSLAPRIDVAKLPSLFSTLTLRQKILMLYFLMGIIFIGGVFKNVVVENGKIDYFILSSVAWFIFLIPVYYLSPNRVINNTFSKILTYFFVLFIFLSLINTNVSVFLHIDILSNILKIFFK